MIPIPCCIFGVILIFYDAAKFNQIVGNHEDDVAPTYENVYKKGLTSPAFWKGIVSSQAINLQYAIH